MQCQPPIVASGYGPWQQSDGLWRQTAPMDDFLNTICLQVFFYWLNYILNFFYGDDTKTCD